MKQYYQLVDPDNNISFEDIVNRFDHKHEDYIEYEEFLRATIDLDTLLTDENIKLVFNYFDKDQSGIITYENIKTTFGIDFKDETKEKEIVQKILKDANLDINGNIKFKDFEQFMKNSLK